MTNVVLTAGRPSILNGFNDFSRLAPFLESKKDLFIEDLTYIYKPELCPAIYNLCLSDWYYQQNRLLDSELILSRTIKEFNKETETRLLFSSLYLQFKILIAQGKLISPDSYIKDIRRLVKKVGHAEFSYNIDAAAIAIVERLRPLLESGKRPMDLCELDLRTPSPCCMPIKRKLHSRRFAVA